MGLGQGGDFPRLGQPAHAIGIELDVVDRPGFDQVPFRDGISPPGGRRVSSAMFQPRLPPWGVPAPARGAPAPVRRQQPPAVSGGLLRWWPVKQARLRRASASPVQGGRLPEPLVWPRPLLRAARHLRGAWLPRRPTGLKFFPVRGARPPATPRRAAARSARAGGWRFHSRSTPWARRRRPGGRLAGPALAKPPAPLP